MNKFENAYGKSRGRERFCTWEKIMKIRIADSEDFDSDRAHNCR